MSGKGLSAMSYEQKVQWLALQVAALVDKADFMLRYMPGVDFTLCYRPHGMWLDLWPDAETIPHPQAVRVSELVLTGKHTKEQMRERILEVVRTLPVFCDETNERKDRA